MERMGGGILVFVLTLLVAAAQDKGGDKSATPAEQYKALLKEYQGASSSGIARSDEERMQFVGRVFKLRNKLALEFVELAEKYPKDPIASWFWRSANSAGASRRTPLWEPTTARPAPCSWPALVSGLGLSAARPV